MNTQELFNLSVGRILEQGDGCVTKSGECRYRNDEGKFCVVGGLIKDEFYDEFFEGQGVEETDVFNAVESSLEQKLEDDQINLLWELQDCHDHCARCSWEGLEDSFMPHFKEKALHIANMYELNGSILT